MSDRTTSPLCTLAVIALVGCAASPPPAEAPAVATATTIVTVPAGPAQRTAPADDAAITKLTARFVDRLDAALDLNDAQTTALRGIFDEYAHELQPHVAYVRSRDSRFAKLEAVRAIRPEIQRLRQRTDDKVQPVLTPDQFARYVELRDELRESLRERFLEG